MGRSWVCMKGQHCQYPWQPISYAYESLSKQHVDLSASPDHSTQKAASAVNEQSTVGLSLQCMRAPKWTDNVALWSLNGNRTHAQA